MRPYADRDAPACPRCAVDCSFCALSAGPDAPRLALPGLTLAACRDHRGLLRAIARGVEAETARAVAALRGEREGG